MSSLPHIAQNSPIHDRHKRPPPGSTLILSPASSASSDDDQQHAEDEEQHLLSMSDRAVPRYDRASPPPPHYPASPHPGPSSPADSQAPEIDVSAEGVVRHLPRAVSRAAQSRALFLKSFHTQRRSKKTICCQLIVPIVLVALVGLIQILFDAYNNSHYVAGLNVTSFPQSVVLSNRSSYLRQMSFPTTSPPSLRPDLGYLYGNGSRAGLLGEVPQWVSINQVDGNKVALMPNFVWADSEQNVTRMLYQRKLASINQAYANLMSPSCNSCPISFLFFEPANASAGNDNDDEGSSKSNGFYASNAFPSIPSKPMSFASESSHIASQYLQSSSSSSSSSSVPFALPSSISITQHPRSTSSSSSPLDSLLSYVIGTETQLDYYHIQTAQTVMNTLNNAYARWLVQPLAADPSGPPLITTRITPLPYVSSIPIFDVGSSAATFLFPFAVSFLLPVYMNDIVLEKEQRLRNMMVMAGLKMPLYWLVAYLYNLLLYVVVFLLLVFVCLAFDLRFMTETSPSLLFLIFFAWGNVQIAFAFFLSTFFSTARVASVIGYILVISSVLISYLLNVTIFDPLKAPLFVFMLYPPFPFYRAVFIIGLKCGFFECTTWDDLHHQPDSQLLTIVIYQFCCIPLYLLLAAYFDQVLPSDTGLRKHPLFFLQPVAALWRRVFARSEEKSAQILPVSRTPSGSEMFSETVEEEEEDAALLPESQIDPLYMQRGKGKMMEEEDEQLDAEVAAEKQRIDGSPLKSVVNASNIVVRALEKSYSNGKQAVRGISLHIPSGQTFGLLGNNGAGKSTTISMLTGVFSPSEGTAYLCGFDIRTEMRHINLIMGVCPQFDHLWPELSVEETVQFYARIKGVPRDEEAAHTRRVLEDIGLAHCPDRLVKELSGGMMRRLSVGIAITADPRVILLDEPTTGLDPVSRAELWEVLLRVKQGRCVILTTHSMSEADYLCERVSVMSNGQLRCIGTPLHLKRRFGRGYSLFLQFQHHEQVGAAVAFVQQTISAEATVRSEFDKSITFEIPEKAIQISALYQRLSQHRSQLGLVDFGISMSTLTDVFLRVSRDAAVDSFR